MPEHPIEISEEAGVRSLHFGSDWIQGAMRIRRPYSLELAYTREMMACLLLRSNDNWPRRALLIGLGAGSLAKYIYRHLEHTRITAVEIDPRIAPMAQQYFHLPVDPQRLKVVIADGADYVIDARSSFDLILVDGFGADARAGRLDGAAFYAAARARLSASGLLVCNLLGRSRGFAAGVLRIAQAFEGRSLVFPSCDSGNAIAFAAAGEPVDVTLEEMRIRAEELRRATGLDLHPTISRLQLAQSLPAGRLVL
ncbi:spermidine synthase [mine drainage metagenome]|uniref:Spermidine synthase n=1 Tax=mine drainage metagenome TaxID=410659 RepID=A0A1J5RYU5_9ZZZZ